MKKISYFEFSSLIITITATLSLGININILKETTEIDSWITIILSYIIGLFIILLNIYISNYQENIPLNKKITLLFGKFFGKIINITIALILFILSMTILYNINSFTTSQFLYRTPIIISTILLVSLVVYNVNKGINVITRVSLLLIYLNIILFIINLLSLVNQIKLDNFLPILQTNPSNIILTSLKLASINTLPLIIIQSIPKNQLTVPKNYNKTIIISYLLGTFISLLVLTESYGVLGKYLVNTFEFPEYMVLKKIKLFGFLERTENISSIQWIIGSYIYLTILVYNISKNIYPNNKSTNQLINIIIGTLLIIITNTIFKNRTMFNTYIKNIFPFITSILLIIYILITLKILWNNKHKKSI